MVKPPAFIALGEELKACPLVKTLGIRPDFNGYSEDELNLMRSADVILFPTWRYLHIFEASGFPTFPSPSTYHILRSPYLQHLLARHLKIPALKAKAYAGRKRRNIPGDFRYPFAIWPVRQRRSSPYIIRDEADLEGVFGAHHFVLVVEIPESLEGEVQVVVIGDRVAGWKGEWLPEEAEGLKRESLRFATSAGIDCGALKWIRSGGVWKFYGLAPVPSNFTAINELPASRREFLCAFLRDIASGRVKPPWRTADRAI